MVVIRVCIKVQADEINNLRSILVSDVLETTKFEGCHHFKVYQDIEAEHNFILYEEWENQDAFDAYRESDYFKAIGAKMMPLLDGKPDSAYYQAEKIS